MAADGGRSARSELQRLARSIPHKSSESHSPARRQRRRQSPHRIDSYDDSAIIRSRNHNTDANSENPSENTSKTIQNETSSPVTRTSSYHTPAESIRGGEGSKATSLHHSSELDRLNLKHGWNSHDAIYENADNAEHMRAYPKMDELEVNGREQGPGKNLKPLERLKSPCGAVIATDDFEGNATFTMPQSSSWREYRSNEKRTSNSRVREVQMGTCREKDKWRDKDSIRDANGEQKDGGSGRRRKRRRNNCICIAILLAILAIVIPVAVVYGMKPAPAPMKSSSTGSSEPSDGNLHNLSHSSIPAWARGGYLDPFGWFDSLDFNVTFTDVKVGGLYIMGLNDTWDDSVKANENVPALNEKWDYGGMPFRGINLGGWLSIEPFITPSLFLSYKAEQAVVDEWSLSQHLGPSNAKSILEKHYSEWVQESTFAEIAAAGFDHVRIPFSYWAVATYTGDPYVPMISFRYLLRGIEWARKYGLRVYLDLHGAPGSQNGWNHSGRQSSIGWLNGTDGDLNAQRTIDIHKQLATFFTQPRYKNIIAMYGLVNEPKMTALSEEKVLA